MGPVDALVITCMDARLHWADRPFLSEYLRGKHVGLKTWDLVAVPGGVSDLVAPDADARQDTLLRAVQVAHDRHGVSTVWLINHSDCGAYGGKRAFADATEEFRKHAADLRAARSTIRERFPNTDARLLYATVEDRPEGPFVTFDEVR